MTAAWWAAAWRAAGWYVFAPVGWVKRDAPPRFSGDGPQSSLEYLTIARPRGLPRDGHRPGYYLVHRVEGPRDGARIPGQKPLDGVRQLVCHYSRRDDLVVDPFAGTGTTLLAGLMEGRRVVGAEVDAHTHAIAHKRLRDFGVGAAA